MYYSIVKTGHNKTYPRNRNLKSSDLLRKKTFPNIYVTYHRKVIWLWTINVENVQGMGKWCATYALVNEYKARSHEVSAQCNMSGAFKLLIVLDVKFRKKTSILKHTVINFGTLQRNLQLMSLTLHAQLFSRLTEESCLSHKTCFSANFTEKTACLL
jgi:hypothetical protein